MCCARPELAAGYALQARMPRSLACMERPAVKSGYDFFLSLHACIFIHREGARSSATGPKTGLSNAARSNHSDFAG